VKRILILGRNHTDPGFTLPDTLAAAVQPHLRAELTVVPAYIQDIEVTAAPGEVLVTHGGDDLAAFDAVFMHGWFADWKDEILAIASYLRKHNVPFLNSEAEHQRSTSKVSQAVLFGMAGLPVPRTFYRAQLHASDDQAVSRCISYIGLPLILKQANGNKGSNNFLIKTRDELIEKLREHPDLRFIAQQFIPNNGDVRVILYKATPHMVIARHADGDGHLHNVSQGGKATLVDPSALPTGIIDACVTASTLMHRELSGMDIVESKDGAWYILESNNMPQLTSGAFADEKAKLLANVLTTLAQ
jgi:glutathione synthase/RimK-type ligase-like ATP-grasp enzyme